MEDLLQKIILESQDDELNAIATAIANLDLTPEEMEKNLIVADKFAIDKSHDKEN